MQNDFSALINGISSSSAKEEILSICKRLQSASDTKKVEFIDRLYRIYIQKKDLRSSAFDFQDLTVPTDSTDNKYGYLDPFSDRCNTENISQFMDKEGEKSESLSMYSVGQFDTTKELIIQDEINTTNKTVVSLEDPTVLKDRNGNFWSGVVLNTDIVQKTTPGNRVNTHRALVVVGNLKGAAGFGMGKGKSGTDAVNSAFR